ncbi:DUF3971 domain-containing protein [Oricola sp.]|uniref:YhdP family protein n=1 Tax=Oricola sp. TaxID=1979950 RepID=UPI0025EA14A3|nr:DUF3971 domain-containing protein [Oricola sp.]MCI5073923.1 DUF3971 domain-containing protein [Oricola sp.]
MRRIERLNFGSRAQRVLRRKPAGEDGSPPADRPTRARSRKRLRRIAVAVIVLILVSPILLAVFVKSGLMAPLIEREAVAALNRALPDDLRADIGDTDVIVEGVQDISVSLGKFALTDRASGRDVLHVDETHIGVRTRSVLRGAPQVDELVMSGVRLDLSGSGSAGGEGEAGGSDLPTVASIEPALTRLLDRAELLFKRTSLNGSLIGISISDMTIVGPVGEILVKKATVSARTAQRTIEAQIEVAGHESTFLAVLSRGKGGRINARVKLDDVALPIGRARTLFSALSQDHEPGASNQPVRANVAVTARRMSDGDPDQLSVSVEPVDLSFKLDEGDFVPFSGKLNFYWAPATKVFRLRKSQVRVGRSSAELTGGFRDADPEADAPPGTYQFELIANDGISDPADSPERGVRYAARVLGLWMARDRLVDFSQLELRSEAGQADGVGSFDFASDTPTAVFAFSVQDFALEGVKQFWPSPVARSARQWVLSNLAGGSVTDGEFLIAEPLRRRIPGSDQLLDGATELSLRVEGVRFDVAGNIPPVRDANGRVEVKDGETTITLETGTAYLPSGRTAAATDGTLVIHKPDADDLVHADLNVAVSGEADALGELIAYRPINAKQFRDYDANDLSGQVDARVTMQFVLNPHEDTPPPDWAVELDLHGASIATPFEGRMLSDMTGRIEIDPTRADIDLAGKIDGIPANIAMTQPFDETQWESLRDIVVRLSDEDRRKIAPGLETLVSGTTPVNLKSGAEGEAMEVVADLSQARLSLPWIGWAKGSGISAKSVFDLVLSDGETRISNFEIDGGSFFANGDITVSDEGLRKASFPKVRLNQSDDISVSVQAKGRGFVVNVTGKSFDARALIRHIREQLKATDEGDGVPVTLNAKVSRVSGFGGEILRDLDLSMEYDGKDVVALTATGGTKSGFPVSFRLQGAGAKRTLRLESLDAGEILRFLDIYGQVRGGVLTVALKAIDAKTLSGTAEVTDYRIFDEPKLNSLVSSKSNGSASLNEAIRREIDTREVKFDRASVKLSISPVRLQVQEGIVRGPEVGATFRGTLYDQNNRMRVTGTFMPAYSVNTLLTGIPIVGLVLGNGRDRGLIGVTFLLEGDVKKPKITVNPLSAIAPGVFRQIFQFR